MNVCPNCQHQEIVGALFCSECGEPLVRNPGGGFSGSGESPQMVTETGEEDTGTSPIQPTGELVGDAFCWFYLLGFSQVIPLKGRKTYTIGRVNDDLPVVPDIDLSEFQAYERGVSRLHATINLSDQPTIMDLGSSNGTWLNGERIEAHKPLPIKQGDILTLGKMNIQIFLRD
jgi:hypothetical protein